MEDITNVWNCEIEILKEVDRICDKYNIRYFASSGTLLGAIRHNGFIPWDDDIDLEMLRPDYERFRKIALSELNDKFFLQSGYTDKDFYGGMLHIRMNGTTVIQLQNYPHTKYHQGIFIDIFPLDGVIENPILFKFQAKCKKLINNIMWFRHYRKLSKFKIKHILLLLPCIIPQQFLFALFESVCKWKKCRKANYVDAISFFGNSGVGKRKTTWYEKTELHVFQNTTIPTPVNYNEILIEMYGTDYMTPRQYSGDHGEVFFDTKHSYKDYLNGTLEIPEEYIKKWQNH